MLRKPLRLGRLFGVPPRLLLWLPPFLLALVPSFAGFACYSFYVINQPVLRNQSIKLRTSDRHRDVILFT